MRDRWFSRVTLRIINRCRFPRDYTIYKDVSTGLPSIVFPVFISPPPRGKLLIFIRLPVLKLYNIVIFASALPGRVTVTFVEREIFQYRSQNN